MTIATSLFALAADAAAHVARATWLPQAADVDTPPSALD